MTTVSIGSKKKSFPSYAEAAASAKIDYMVFYMRIRNGWTVARALSTPVKKRKTK